MTARNRFVMAAFVCAIASGPARADDAPVISRVTIRGTDIFDVETKTYLDKFPYSWINALHIQTRDFVIRAQLLFKEGDRLDPFLLRETERNLRALDFIRAARISTFPQRDGTVALVVHVNDSWTTEPRLSIEGSNGVDEIEVGFREKNFFGLGKSVGFSYNDGPDFTEREFSYSDPAIFQSRWKGTAKYIDKTDGQDREVLIERPFYSADTPWSSRASHVRTEELQKEFEDDVQISEFRQTKEVSQVAAAVKVGGGRTLVNHVGLRYKRENRFFDRTAETSAERAIPERNRFQTVFLDYEAIENRFIETTHLEKMTRIEDVNLGPVLRLSPGFSPRSVTGRDDTSEFEASYEQRFLISNLDLFEFKAKLGQRQTFSSPENERYEVNLKYYNRRLPRQTLVYNLRFDWGDELESDNRIELGSQNGLRAFEETEAVGDRSWVMNLEDRFFFIDELWNLVSVGGVACFDAGTAWEKGESLSTRVRSAAGAGLRLGLTRSSNEIIVRVDVAYRLQRSATSDDRFVVMFGSGQAF